MFLLMLLYSFVLEGVRVVSSLDSEIDPAECQIWGPGLLPDQIVMPARYFYIQAVDNYKHNLTESPGDVFDIQITGSSSYKECRIWINTLDRKDGSFIVRYKTYHTCHDFKIHVTYRGIHIGASPYIITGLVYADGCYCPVKSVSGWLKQFGCRSSYNQINLDLEPFLRVNFTELRKTALQKFNHPGSMSICNYVVKDNQISEAEDESSNNPNLIWKFGAKYWQVYRKCYGQYVGFKIFLDAILLSLARKVYLPDMEILFNLGDWPLVSIEQKPHIPLFSWCGSNDTLDIVMPTYGITEATLECMGRVMLDMLSVQGNIDKKWDKKIEKAFWRGRDSRRERLKLITIAREHPDLFNASLTNFFFYRDEEKDYGPKVPHISFFKFFEYKYQINIDGTVAAYRFPYLLAGDSLVFKQNSKYYEHFYNEVEPWKHYVPIKSDLSDLVEKIQWAKENDAKAQIIASTGQKFAQENLMPQDVFCYHAVLFKEWSNRLTEKVEVEDGMDHVAQPAPEKPYMDCNCHRSYKTDKVISLNALQKDLNVRDEL